MPYIVKTQVISIIVSVFWLLYLNIIAFFDTPGRAMEHINMYVYGFAAIFLLIDVLMFRRTIRGDWTSLPLILIPELVLYQPILFKLISALIPNGYDTTLRFLSASLGMIYILTTAIAIIIGIMVGRVKK